MCGWMNKKDLIKKYIQLVMESFKECRVSLPLVAKVVGRYSYIMFMCCIIYFINMKVCLITVLIFFRLLFNHLEIVLSSYFSFVHNQIYGSHGGVGICPVIDSLNF